MNITASSPALSPRPIPVAEWPAFLEKVFSGEPRVLAPGPHAPSSLHQAIAAASTTPVLTPQEIAARVARLDRAEQRFVRLAGERGIDEHDALKAYRGDTYPDDFDLDGLPDNCGYLEAERLHAEAVERQDESNQEVIGEVIEELAAERGRCAAGILATAKAKGLSKKSFEHLAPLLIPERDNNYRDPPLNDQLLSGEADPWLVRHAANDAYKRLRHARRAFLALRARTASSREGARTAPRPRSRTSRRTTCGSRGDPSRLGDDPPPPAPTGADHRVRRSPARVAP